MSSKPAELTKQGNYLIRSSRSTELIEFGILIQAGRVRRNGKGSGAQITKKDGSWAGNAHWEMLMFLNRGLAEYDHYGTGVSLTKLGEKMLSGARFCTSSVSREDILHKIDSKKID